jgi:hypothetical protein
MSNLEYPKQEAGPATENTLSELARYAHEALDACEDVLAGGGGAAPEVVAPPAAVDERVGQINADLERLLQRMQTFRQRLEALDARV